jgi:hypothetical protein
MNIRSSDVFLKADITAILSALSYAAQANANGNGNGNGDYLRGYFVALATVATALSIQPADVIDITRGYYTGDE